jgi:hypothetical protein
MRVLSAAALLSVVMIAAAEPALAGSAPLPVAETRNCAWQAKIDPYGVNALFPDRAARYWLLQLPAAAGMSLDIHGRFPHSRYISFTSYDPALGSVDGLDDARIRPDQGSRNPFLAGASRRVPDGRRAYTVRVVQGPRPSRPAANHLYTGSSDGSRSAAYFSVIYRDYRPDRGYGDDGGVGLPSVTVRTPAGAVPLPACTAPVAPATGLNDTVAHGALPAATPACGITWLPLGPGPATVLIERNMLPAAGFRHSIQRARYDHERMDLGPYYPATRYASVAQTERLDCHHPARAGSR